MLPQKWEYEYLFKKVTLFPLDIYSDMKLLDHMGVLFLIFGGHLILFSIVALSTFIPAKNVQVSPLLHIHASICYLLCFW